MKSLKNDREKRVFNDRRKFNYSAYLPERRSGMDRRDVDANEFNVRMA
ncbi:MAG: hypothetical protein H8D87_05235 [Deltaproteobacteria bacterium]|nr:hypothetical protein [Candidatus Desulfobacula maris]MBL6995204.1 hypothetical protein [Desulfobacula sp.]